MQFDREKTYFIQCNQYKLYFHDVLKKYCVLRFKKVKIDLYLTERNLFVKINVLIKKGHLVNNVIMFKKSCKWGQKLKKKCHPRLPMRDQLKKKNY